MAKLSGASRSASDMLDRNATDKIQRVLGRSRHVRGSPPSRRNPRQEIGYAGLVGGSSLSPSTYARTHMHESSEIIISSR